MSQGSFVVEIASFKVPQVQPELQLGNAHPVNCARVESFDSMARNGVLGAPTLNTARPFFPATACSCHGWRRVEPLRLTKVWR